GGTMNDLITALNAPGSGVGVYGAFSLDPNGQLTFSAPPGPGRTLTVVQDDTERGARGPSRSAFFGLDHPARPSRAGTRPVRADLKGDASKLALGQLDLNVPAGAASLSMGDTRGADALSRVGQMVTSFDPAGSVGAATYSLSEYAAEFGGHIGR